MIDFCSSSSFEIFNYNIRITIPRINNRGDEHIDEILKRIRMFVIINLFID